MTPHTDTPDATPAGPPPAAGEAGERYASEKHCCTVCGRKKVCTVCGLPTLYACSDCRIDFRTTIYVCGSKRCRDEHEAKCSARLRDRLDRAGPRLAALAAALADVVAQVERKGYAQTISPYQGIDLDAARAAIGAAGPGAGATNTGG